MQNTTKTALITGGARRVGAQIARTLHDVGMNVVIHYERSEKEANELCQLLNSKRENSAVAIQCDLFNISSLDNFLKQIINTWGRLDILVNNAARFYPTKIASSNEVQWDDLLDRNLKAPYFLAQKAMPYLIKTKGTIINIADVHAERPLQNYGIYCISKAGLVMLTKVLAKELGPDVRVNTVSPGTVMLPEGEAELSQQEQQHIIKKTALKKYGSAQDVADAVLYLLNANYVTGQVITVDGGRCLSM